MTKGAPQQEDSRGTGFKLASVHRVVAVFMQNSDLRALGNPRFQRLNTNLRCWFSMPLLSNAMAGYKKTQVNSNRVLKQPARFGQRENSQSNSEQCYADGATETAVRQGQGDGGYLQVAYVLRSAYLRGL